MIILSVRFDPEADAGHVRYTEGRIDGSDEVAPGLIVDFSAENEPLGLEVLFVRERIGAGDVHSYLRGLAEGWLAHHVQPAMAAG